jgi:hypothetical protein
MDNEIEKHDSDSSESALLNLIAEKGMEAFENPHRDSSPIIGAGFTNQKILFMISLSDLKKNRVMLMKTQYPIADALLRQIKEHDNTDLKMDDISAGDINDALNFLQKEELIRFEKTIYNDGIPPGVVPILNFEGKIALGKGVKKYIRKKRLFNTGLKIAFILILSALLATPISP